MAIRFGTLFDRRYATRGIAMLESLEAFRRPGDDVVVLAIDDDTKRMLQQIGNGRWRVVSVTDLGDNDLLRLQSERPHREFCWTCAPALSAYLVELGADGDTAAYIDADLYFFGDPRDLLKELDGGGSILIHEHRFSPDRTSWLTTSGRFNVGFVAFHIGDEARACVTRWRSQTIEVCVSDPEKGLCGDQGYLTEWPQLYPNLRILQNLGGGVAPWNVNQYVVSNSDNRPRVNEVPVIFFHYHALRTVFVPPFGLVAVQPAAGYEFSSGTQAAFYQPYVLQLRGATGVASRAGLSVQGDITIDQSELWRGFLGGHYVLTINWLKSATGFFRKLIRYGGHKLAGVGRLITQLGVAIADLADWGTELDRLDLAGDRDVEWAWVAAKVPERAGRVLDLGPATSFTPLIASFNANEVIGLDLDPPPVTFAADNLVYKKGDVGHGGLPDGKFDTIINCSTTEHIGLSGRYGSAEDPDGDLKAMALLRGCLNGPNARMVFTIPVGRDGVYRPFHRIYGVDRLPLVLAGFRIVEERYYAKPAPPNVWVPVSKEVALNINGSARFYGLGLFVLALP